ncbi:hypothetical protein [Gulosibacter chungangensis]|uniref:Nuclear transport factor 2 family protein n=1 Tax=Gulosibacter chungangensis TaxID=979746 RepID=A0A7J5BB96_9MICO|nr:hypothetical protein [Gulosibacter chungangensis]KAB1643377.1 hypothetical protein F8O05_05655 [Gulosibacter chungangensis]
MTESLRPLLADDVRWDIFGEPELDAETALSFPQDIQEIEVFTAINHGRASSCNGRMLAGAQSIDFCHVFRFSGVAKTAKIVHIRTYLVRA